MAQITGTEPTASLRRRELLTVGEAKLDVLIDGSGPSLVLLPSSLRDSVDYGVLAEALAGDGYQVLRPQPRGMQASSPPPADMTLETLADDVAAVIHHFSAEPAVVVGHAYGHWIARMTDLRCPMRVRGVVALGAAARHFPLGMAEALARASDPTQAQGLRLEALRHCMFAKGNDPRPWLTGWYPQWRRVYQDASIQPPRDRWYHRANSPLLDLQGSEDAWRPAETRQELLQALGGTVPVDVQVIYGAGHALVPEQPLAIADAVAAWCRQIGHGVRS